MRRGPRPRSTGDAQSDPHPAVATLPDSPTTSRLNKRMSELGLCSRREADEWIANGWVRVNGEPARMGMQVAPDAHIDVDPKARGQQQQQVTVLLHKPMGYVSGQAEDGHEPAI